MKIAIVLILATPGTLCLDVDDFLSVLGHRFSSLNRSDVMDVLEVRARKLNVTAQSHADACTDLFEQLSERKYAPNDTILVMMNSTDLNEIFHFVLHNEDRSHEFVFEKLGVIRSKLKALDLDTDIIVERMVNQISNAIGDIGKLQVVQDSDIDRVINKLKSKASRVAQYESPSPHFTCSLGTRAVERMNASSSFRQILALYELVNENGKRELERIFCAQTLLDVLDRDPAIAQIISKFAAANSIFLDDFIDATKARGNFSVSRAIEILEEEANRVGVPVQIHIDQCLWAHYCYWNFSIIDESLEEFNRNNLKGRRINSTKELFNLLDEAPDAWNEVASSMNFIQVGLEHVSATAQQFIKDIGQSIITILIDAVNRPDNTLTSWSIISKMHEKVTGDFKKLSMQDKNDLEREFCIFTSIRLFNGTSANERFIGSLRSTGH